MIQPARQYPQCRLRPAGTTGSSPPRVKPRSARRASGFSDALYSPGVELGGVVVLPEDHHRILATVHPSDRVVQVIPPREPDKGLARLGGLGLRGGGSVRGDWMAGRLVDIVARVSPWALYKVNKGVGSEAGDVLMLRDLEVLISSYLGRGDRAEEGQGDGPGPLDAPHRSARLCLPKRGRISGGASLRLACLSSHRCQKWGRGECAIANRRLSFCDPYRVLHNRAGAGAGRVEAPFYSREPQ
jgi:hypothetical protein